MQSVAAATSLDFPGAVCAAEREKQPLQTALRLAGGKRRGGCLLMSCSSKSLSRFSPWPPWLEYPRVGSTEEKKKKTRTHTKNTNPIKIWQGEAAEHGDSLPVNCNYERKSTLFNCKNEESKKTRLKISWEEKGSRSKWARAGRRRRPPAHRRPVAVFMRHDRKWASTNLSKTSQSIKTWPREEQKGKKSCIKEIWIWINHKNINN